MHRNSIRILVAVALVASACAVQSTGVCETDADCKNGGQCVDGLCTGGEVPTATIVSQDEVDLGAQVSLDGTTSAKATGGADGLSFAWTVTAGGADVAVEAGNTASAMLQAAIPHATYKAELVVSDRGTPSVVATKEIRVRNTKPVARLVATPAQTAWLRNVPVTLDATTSTDADGDALTYEWTLEKDPPTATATFTPGTNGTATLTPGPTSASYKVTVKVSDGTATVSESIQQMLDNKPPEVNAGTAQTVDHTCTGTPGAKTCKAIGTLSGTATDTDGTIDEGSIEWRLKSAPAASLATASFSPSAFSPSVSFVISNASTEPIAGDYEFELRAKDNDNTERKATVVVTVGNRPPVISLGDVNPLLVNHSFAAGSFSAPVSVTATATDEDNDDITTTFEMTTDLTGATVTPGAITQTTASYTISVAQENPTSLIDGTNPLYAVKARVIDRNAATADVELPVAVQNRAPVPTGFTTGVQSSAEHKYTTTATAPFTTAGYSHVFTGLTFNATDADGDILTATWTVTGGPAGTTVIIPAGAGTPVKPTSLGFISSNAGIVTAPLTATQTVSDPFGQIVSSKQFKIGNRAPTTTHVDRNDVGHKYGAQAWAGAGNFYYQNYGAVTVSDADGDPLTAVWTATSASVPVAELKFQAAGSSLSPTIDFASTNKLLVNNDHKVKVTMNDGFGAVAVEKTFRMGNRDPVFDSFTAPALAYSCTGTQNSCPVTAASQCQFLCLAAASYTHTSYGSTTYSMRVKAKVSDPDGDPITVSYASKVDTCAAGPGAAGCPDSRNVFLGGGAPLVQCTAGQQCPDFVAPYGLLSCTSTTTAANRTAVGPSSIHGTATDGFTQAYAAATTNMQPNGPPASCSIVILPD